MRGGIQAIAAVLAASTLVAPAAWADPPTSPVHIPLELLLVQQSATFPTQYRLGINVGINGGQPRLYLFDTGSALFNAAYTPAFWPGIAPSNNAGTGNAPVTTVTNGSGVQYCYGANLASCRGWQGNIVQVGQVSFYDASSTLVSSLSASPGYQVNAVYNQYIGGAATLITGTAVPVEEGVFYGVFGAGQFTTQLGNYTAGGVLGQTMVSGPNIIAQGYVVAANGQANPASAAVPAATPNVPLPGANGVNVLIGGSRQSVTSCSPCVTLGLTPQMLGQFAPFMPGGTTATGLVPWDRTGPSFPNPYGTGTGNNSSTEFGYRFSVMLASPTGVTALSQASTLLDTGTGGLTLASALNKAGISTSNGQFVQGGVTLTANGLAGNSSIAGLPSSISVLQDPNYVPITYQATFDAGLNGAGTTNTLGLSFFLQNSVMFDLTNQAVGYTPFFVTDANLVTTANGPLVVDGTNVALGLAGIISGPGGVTVNSGGALQLSATNTYTGVTTIAGPSGGSAAGKLLISGPGSIAASAGVVNNGVFDISRAWPLVSTGVGSVAVQTLSGTGVVYLGANNLTLSNASTTFNGTLSDGGSYPGTGGSVTLTGGAFTLAGSGVYTGGTIGSGGTFTVSGSLIGGLGVGQNGTFTVAPGGVMNTGAATTFNFGQINVAGTFTGNIVNSGTATTTGTINGSIGNLGSFVDNGVVNGNVINNGTLSGSGLVAGSVVNNGIIAPGNSIGTLSIGGTYQHASSATYQTEANGAGQSDLVNVGGAATLQGGSVSVYAQPGTNYAARTTYRILNAAGGLSGSFASVNEPYPFLLSSLSYDASNAYLTLQIGGFAAAAATPTQASVGAVLDANVNTATGDFAQVLSALATGVQTNLAGQYALQSLSGNNYAGFSSFMVQGAQLFMNNFANQAGGGGSPASTRVAVAEACNVACDTASPPKWGAWGGGLGGLGTIGAGQPVGGVTYNAGGFAAGLDRLVTDTLRVGVTAGYTAGTQWVNGFSGVGRSDTFQTGLYANYAQDKLYADALVGYAYTWNQMWRQISIPLLQPRTARGLTGVNQWYGQLETGYRFDLGTNANAFITPFARLQAYTGTQNGFTETGAQSLNLTVAQQTTNSLRSVLGAQIGGAMDLGWREKLAMQLRLGWSHEYADVGRPVTATLAGAPAMPFTTWGISPTRDGALIGLSANTSVADATSIYFRYEGVVSGQDNAHAFTAGLRLVW